jgi:hypothetical protein
LIRYKTHANTEGKLVSRLTEFHRQQNPKSTKQAYRAPNCKLETAGTRDNNELRRSPEQNSIGVCTGQTGESHRSDRCDLSSRDEQHLWVNSPKSNSRSPESLHGFAQDFGVSRNTSWALHSQDFVHQNLLNQGKSKKSRQELL